MTRMELEKSWQKYPLNYAFIAKYKRDTLFLSEIFGIFIFSYLSVGSHHFRSILFYLVDYLFFFSPIISSFKLFFDA